MRAYYNNYNIDILYNYIVGTLVYLDIFQNLRKGSCSEVFHAGFTEKNLILTGDCLMCNFVNNFRKDKTRHCARRPPRSVRISNSKLH